MVKKSRRFAAMAAALTISLGMLPTAFSQTGTNADAAYGTGKNIMESLDRGINAINTGSGMMVSWRFNADDNDNTVFKLYRDNTLIYTSNADKATCYLDKNGSSKSKYKVETIVNGAVVSSDSCDLVSNKSYFDIPLNIPTGKDCTYSANDCSVGDVDGDGQYEIFLKWDPSNQKDNSQQGYTGNVYIDCYTLEGKQLWRIDLGKNIRAGAHYTQFLVADFDCDGKAEMTCKTADGTVDGTGKVIGDASKDYRNSSGYILSGPEYYTLFDGATGKALDTVDYAIPRGNNLKKDWGDDYGNRVDRYNGAVVYLDGVKPSAVSGRGYYTQLNAVAYDVVDDKLVERWVYRSGNDPNKGYHNGNHNCMAADVDGDGRQELCFGSTCLDDDGTLLWCNNQGHGDAMHLGDFLPDRAGLELWMCHENEPWGVSLIDAKTGKNIFHKNHTKDTGRACCGNILASNPGAEFWGATGNDIFDANGKTIASNKPAQNFMIYWDGDLEREILDGTKIDKYISVNKINRLLTADGCASNNGSKSNPCLSADIFGDWREELLLRSGDSKYLRVYATPYSTDVRLTTLMHDPQYRTQAAGEQNCYNQPAHPSFYLGSDEPLPERPAVTINGSHAGLPSNPTIPTEPVQPTEPSIPSTKPVSYNFDLGANAQNGCTSVSATERYSATKGYGFSASTGVTNVNASGSGALSDAVQFTGNTTFNVDLPKGLYHVKVTLGNTSRTSVYMENMLQIVNMTGNNAVDEILLPVTDGQLNIRAAAGKAGYAYTISAVEIEKVSDSAVMPNTVWLCGDSTVCNYYPLNTSTQAGWGQVLDQYIDDSRIVRNMAASGQYAKGFVDAGQFDAIEYYGKKGDVYIISIGINDTNYSNATEYYNTVTDMVKRAKAKGMEVILVKQQGRKGDYTKNPLLTSRWFAAQLDQIGKEQKVQVVDLFNLFQDYCVSIGADKADALFIDNIHPNRQGAMKLAELFVSQVTWDKSSGSTTRALKGDVNLDGTANGSDTVELQNYLTKNGKLTAAQKQSADMNGDGVVNAFDMAILKKALSKHYAEDAAVENGVSETTNTGFTGSSYINLDNSADSTITWTLNAFESGNYLVTFCMANGTETDRSMKIEVNGSSDYWIQSFNGTGAWTTWAERGIVLPLKKGANTVKLSSMTKNGGPNFDYVKMELTDEPIAETYQPTQKPLVPDSENPVIYIAGDSTVQTYRESYAPQQGWGYYLGNYFEKNVTVSNQAIAGRSSKSFYDNGRLDTILETMKTGDYLFIQFGINDAASNKAERYAPVCGNVNDPADGSFEFYMKKYIEGTLKKGGTPVLVTTVIGLKSYSGGKFVNSYTGYCNAMKQLAAKYDIPCIDLNTLMVNHYNSIGYDAAYQYHMCATGSTDMTHFTETGADAVAELVAEAVKAMHLPISDDVK